MPELSRDALSTKLDAIPEADREPYVQALKAQGYTWKSDQQAITNDAPAEIKPPPSDPNFEIAGRSQTAAAPAPAYLPRPGVQSSEFASPLKTFLTNDPVDPFNTMLRGLPAAVGGSIAGAAVAPATGLIGTGAAYGAGAAAIESARQGLAQAYAGVTGREFAPNDEVLKHIGAQAAMNAAGGALTKAPQAFGKAYDYAAKNLGGLSGGALETIKDNASAVAQRLGVTRADIGALADKIRGAVSGAVEAAGRKYSEVAKAITGGPQVPNINLSGGIADTVAKVGEDFGYTGVGRISDAGESALFARFAEKANSLGQATARDVYYFQRDLANAIRANAGKPISAALGQIKGAVNSHLPEAAKNAPALAPLVEANAGYAASMELEKEASKLTNANDAIQFIKNAYNPNRYSSQAKDTLEAIGSQVPEVGALVKEARLAMAAEEAGNLIRPLPQNGAGTGLVAGAGAAASEVLGSGGLAKRAATAALFPFFSPRTYLAGYQASQAIGRSGAGQAAGAAIEAAAPAIPVASTALANYYQAGGR